jgi:cation diffusion facilitator family transporter
MDHEHRDHHANHDRHPSDRAHHHRDGRAHTHGIVDPSIASTGRGLWALKWSFVGLTATAALQVIVFFLSGSVGLLADTIHNFADAATAVPLGSAFWLARRHATRRFTYGLGRVEDFAGLAIMLIILASAAAAAYESVRRFFHPHGVDLLWAVMLAGVIGFLGNEGVAIFRIRVGREIGSAALIADGYHARVDGWTSLAVFAGALGIWAGYPLADPLVGVLIAVAIFVLVYRSAPTIIRRMLDGVETSTLDAIVQAATHVGVVQEVMDIRARWIGHRLHADLSVTVPAGLSIEEGHNIATEVRHQLLHHVPHLGTVHVHVDPTGQGGERYHRIGEHAHDGLPRHSHD